MVVRTEQKAGSSPALKFYKPLGLTGVLVCFLLVSPPPLSALNGGKWVLSYFDFHHLPVNLKYHVK